MPQKVNVGVVALHNPDGSVKPLEMIWPDDTRYEIDKVIDVRRGSNLKVGIQGVRYTCKISGKEAYLFDDQGRWYVEGRG